MVVRSTRRGRQAREEIVRIIRTTEANHHFWPTLNEIAAAIGLSRSATYKHLCRLRDDGIVELGQRRFSGWRLR